MIKVGIIGGGGYTAGELIRLLQYHPKAEINFIHSKSQAGKLVSEVHDDLVGECFLTFTNEVHFDLDVLFLCQGHGASTTFFLHNDVPKDLLVIDLSRDFRLKKEENEFIYGLPELNKSSIQSSKQIANPGCFATAIQLALLPLASKDLLTSEVHIHALTGSTGAGQSPKSSTHFSWRNNNISIYKAFNHQHLDEIEQSVKQLQPEFDQMINFLPIRGDFTRGIFASLYTNVGEELENIQEVYEDFYADAPYVHLSKFNPSLKQVVNTNKCLVYLEKHDDKLLIISMIDNLLKGASGQAVQNMNLAMGFEETMGLQLKATVF